MLPVFTIVDGRRRGVRQPWLYFALILFTTLTFAWAFYLATIERQRRVSGTEADATQPASRASSA